jgi:hypothetical protein
MSGPLTIPLAILALFVSNHTLKISYAVLAVASGFYAGFAVWLNERRRYEAIEISRNVRAEWQSLKLKFDGYVKDAPFIGAAWTIRQTMPTHTTWHLFGGRDELERDSLMVLLEESGNILLSCRWVARDFKGITERDPVFRWLNFLCEIQSESMQVSNTGHDRGVKYEGGEITQLARKCSLLCARLAAKETWPSPEVKSSLQ